jgi:CRP/FNR family transcriptional regulator
MTARFRQQQFIEGVLGNVAVFTGAPPADLAATARQSWVLEARRGDALARRGERLPGLFVVGYGLAKLTLRAPGMRERVLRLVGAGQAFGAAPALLGRASPYEVCALVDAKLVVVPSAPLHSLIDRNPAFGRSMVKMLAEQSFELLKEVEAATLLRSGQRLASYLGSLARPVDGNGRWSVQLPVSKTLVAARLGMKKETLSRLLRKLADEGLIEVCRSEIAVLDRDGLARAAQV